MAQVTDAPEERGLESITLIIRHGLTLVLLAAALVIYMGVGFLGFRWAQQPFLGAFVEVTMVFNGVGPARTPEWDTVSQVGRGQLVSIDGVPIANTAALQRELSARQAGEAVTLTVAQADGSLQQ